MLDFITNICILPFFDVILETSILGYSIGQLGQLELAITEKLESIENSIMVSISDAAKLLLFLSKILAKTQNSL